MSETTTRPMLATATVEVMREQIENDEQKAWLLRTLLPTLWDAAINAGGIGMYNMTDLKIVENGGAGRRADYQRLADERADEEGRERWTVPPIDVAVVDATIVWPPDGPVGYREDS